VLEDVLRWHVQSAAKLALVGGVAVGVHSRPRATKDIDFSVVTSAEPAALAASLAAFAFSPAFKESVEMAEAKGVLPMLHTNGMIADFIYPYLPYQEQRVLRAVRVKVGKLRVPILTVEDLAAMKLEAGRPQDLVDVQQLVRANPRMRVKEVLASVRAYAEMIEEPELYKQAQLIFEPSFQSQQDE
jgi:hypothetical protein